MLKFTTSGCQVFETKRGPVGLGWGPKGVSRLEFAPRGMDGPVPRPEPAVAGVIRRLKAHLAGKIDPLTDVPVDLAGVGDYGRKVLRRLRKVAPGTAVTYGELARATGRPGAARAVGRIMGANPVPVIVPCHRCLGADGALTGFSADGGVDLKAKLLFAEGYVFDAAHQAGIDHLRRRDPVMRRLIDFVGPYRALPDKPRPPWDTLVIAIIHQQLSVKAGRTIDGRVRKLTPGDRMPTPAEVLDLTHDDLRGCGLSNMKVTFVQDLAARVHDGRLKLGRLRHLDDDAVIAELTKVRGIGPWSAQMHLIFHLGRLDVLPTGDLGLQMAAAKAYGLDEYATPAELTELAEKWRPYRSMGSYYLWRALDQGGIS